MTLMGNKRKLKLIWQQLPVDYYDKGLSNNLFQKIWHKHKMNVLKNILPKGRVNKIIDIGCASGIITNYLTSIYPQADIVGMDVYQEIIRYAKTKHPNIKFIVGDAHKIPFSNDSYDLVLCYETIEHVINPMVVLHEIKRLVKKDGVVIIAMDSGNLLFRLIWFIWERTKGKVWRNAHLHPFSQNCLEQLIRDSDFKIKQKYFSHFGMEVIFILSK